VRTLQVGSNPTGLAANPKRNEVYVVNTGSSNVSVIDAEQIRSSRPLAFTGAHTLSMFLQTDTGHTSQTLDPITFLFSIWIAA